MTYIFPPLPEGRGAILLPSPPVLRGEGRKKGVRHVVFQTVAVAEPDRTVPVATAPRRRGHACARRLSPAVRARLAAAAARGRTHPCGAEARRQPRNGPRSRTAVLSAAVPGDGRRGRADGQPGGSV